MVFTMRGFFVVYRRIIWAVGFMRRRPGKFVRGTYILTKFGEE
jgi:hypothetical protein